MAWICTEFSCWETFLKKILLSEPSLNTLLNLLQNFFVCFLTFWFLGHEALEILPNRDQTYTERQSPNHWMPGKSWETILNGYLAFLKIVWRNFDMSFQIIYFKAVCIAALKYRVSPSEAQDIFLFPDQDNKIMLLSREIMGRFAPSALINWGFPKPGDRSAGTQSHILHWQVSSLPLTPHGKPWLQK